ncbi:FKBP-type peptidyl-prolyl cis-trans isomerase [Streptomyces sp. O3]
MRRRSLLLSVPAGLLALAGCGDEKGDKSVKTTAEPTVESASLPEITKGVKFGEKPTVAKGSGEPSSDLQVETVIAGDGGEVAKGDYLQADYLGQIWDTAKVFDDSYDRGAPAVFQIGVGRVVEGWDQGLVGKKIGSRVELAIPPELGYGEQGQPQAGIKGTDTLVFVVDIVDSFNGKSSVKGTEVAQDDIDLPKVGANTDGKAPSIDVPEKDAPKKLVANYVLEGDGEELEATDGVLVQYKGVLWDGGKQFDASYQRDQLAQFGLNQVIKGWSQGLTGKKVGSRVLIVVPPDLGYGDEKKEGIPANSTLVFSVDILAKM